MLPEVSADSPLSRPQCREPPSGQVPGIPARLSGYTDGRPNRPHNVDKCLLEGLQSVISGFWGRMRSIRAGMIPVSLARRLAVSTGMSFDDRTGRNRLDIV